MNIEKYRDQLGMNLERSSHKKGGRPCKNEREEHYLGEKTINKVKGAITGVKEGFKTAKDVYKTGKDIYNTAKKAAPEIKKFYHEDVEPLRGKVSETAQAVRKRLGKTTGGNVEIAKSYPHGTDPRDVKPWARKAVDVTREEHYAGLAAGVMKAAPMIAKAIAPSLIGWGAKKAFDKMEKKKKPVPAYGGGKIMEKRGIDTEPSKLSRKEKKLAPGGVAKIRRGQYSD